MIISKALKSSMAASISFPSRQRRKTKRMELLPKIHRPISSTVASNSSLAWQETCLTEHRWMKTSNSSFCIKQSWGSTKNKKRGNAWVISQKGWFGQGWERKGVYDSLEKVPFHGAVPSNSLISSRENKFYWNSTEDKTSRSSSLIKWNRESNKNKKRGTSCVISRKGWFGEEGQRNWTLQSDSTNQLKSFVIFHGCKHQVSLGIREDTPRKVELSPKISEYQFSYKAYALCASNTQISRCN